VADPEHRHVARQGIVDEVQLEAVAPVADAGGLGMGPAPIPRRIDVSATGQHEANCTVEDRRVIDV
jgi:hypothetical protein